MKAEHKQKLSALVEAWRQRATDLRRDLRTKKQWAAIGESKRSVDTAIAAYEDRADELERTIAACE